jgi:ABC-type uncharacterized transport system involved in gliding motility auxiliary subunit
MSKKALETLLLSTGGVLLVFVILVAGNFLLSAVPARIDLTQGDVYTLSDGTRQVLGKLESPVKIRFYYSQGNSAVPVQLKTFAKRVEDLLAEYKSASKGKLVIEKLNPEPDSDAEDSATLDGVDGQLTNTQEKFYLGLSVSFLDQKVAIPILAPERERLLEYDITRAISQVTQTKKPVVGVMSALPVFGRSLDPTGGKQPADPWVVLSELKRNFDVREVAQSAARIPDDIKVLLVIHPRDLTEEGEYAIDQFVLRGGKLIAFLDPYCYFDQQRDVQNPFGGTQASSSSFPRLLKAWGYDMPLGKVVADLTFASGQGARLLPTLLNLQGDALNQDDVVTSQVGTMLIPFGSWLDPIGAAKDSAKDGKDAKDAPKETAKDVKPVTGLTPTILARTSPNSMLVDLIIATLTGEPSTRGFEPSGKEHALALRLSGKFKTAFPEGKPQPYTPPPPPPKKGEKAAPAPVAKPAADVPHLTEAKEDTQVVIVSDADMLADGAAVEVQEVFGQKVIVPRNGNLNFLQSLVEQFAGDSALGSLRSRAAFSKPLTVTQNLAQRAQEQYLGKIKELEDNLQQTQDKLQALQKARGAGAGTVLTPEQQTEVEAFRKKSLETKGELKELRKTLRTETDRLEFITKLINIGLMPVLVALAGLLLYLSRRRRAAARA